MGEEAIFVFSLFFCAVQKASCCLPVTLTLQVPQRVFWTLLPGDE